MTLIEILAVIVILGMLAVAVSVGISGMVGEASGRIAKLQMRDLAEHVELYRQLHRQLPGSGEGLAVLSAPQASPDTAYYVEPAKLKDPWGRPFVYLVPGPQGHDFEIQTLGADGQPGGSGENADLSTADAGIDS